MNQSIQDLTDAVAAFAAAQADNTAAIEAAITDLQTMATNQGINSLIEAQVTAIKAATAATKNETAKLQGALAAITPPAPTPAPTPTPTPTPAPATNSETTPILDGK